MRHFILGAALIFACGKASDKLQTRDHTLVVLEGDGNFGSVPVSTTSAPRAITVRPSAPSNSLQFDVIEAIESTCSEFVIDAATAAGTVVQRFCTMFVGGDTYGGGGEVTCAAFAEVTYSFDVTFKPTLELPSSDQCRIIVRLDGGESRSITVSGTGAPPPKRAVFSTKDDIDFNTVNQGQQSNANEVAVTNTGSSNLNVGASLTGSTVFKLIGTQATHPVSPTATELYSVHCEPPDTDPDPTSYTGTLTITTDDPDAAEASVTYDLACTGIDHPLNPNIQTRVETRVEEEATITVNLPNISPGSITLGTISLEAPSAPGLTISAATPPGAIGIGGSASVTMKWKPPAAHAGDLGALIVVVNGEPNRKVSVVGTAIARLADVSSNVPPNEKLDFGKMCIGESRSRPIKMQPAGSDFMTFANYQVTGASSEAPFSATVGTPNTVEVSPPSEVTVNVTAMPALTDGIFDRALTVTTNSPTEPTYDIPLVVEVLPSGASVSPALLNFRDVVVTGFSETKTATFTNCTADTIQVTGIFLDGDSAADFDIIQIMPNGVEQLPPFMLPRNGEVVVAVQMLPQSDGSKEAQVSIDFQEPGMPNTGNETIALLGEGFFPTPDRDSYYRCSAGSPAHALPLLVVSVFLVVRRRRRR